jgi:hypothetical protein
MKGRQRKGQNHTKKNWIFNSPAFLPKGISKYLRQYGKEQLNQSADL